MPDAHRQAINAIMSCRSALHGFTVYECEKCGNTHYIHLGCGNRHCPSCQSGKALNWMDTQLEKLLPRNYFMITFTVPEEMRPFNRKLPVFKYLKAQKDRRLPSVMSRKEVDRLLRHVRTFHNYSYLTTVYSCGLRLQEGLYLQVTDI